MEVATAMDTTEPAQLLHSQQQQQQPQQQQLQQQQQQQQQEGLGMVEGTPVRMEFSTHACSVLSDLRQSGLLCDAVIKVFIYYTNEFWT